MPAGGLAENPGVRGLGKLLGDSFFQLAGFGLESMLGQPNAMAVSGILSGVASGATMGAMTGTPHGIAAGAIIGGIAGVGNAITAVAGAEDDAFKRYYQEQYQTAGTRNAAELQNGSFIAGGREGTHIAFSQLLGGAEAAGEYLRDVRKLAVDTSYTFDEITGYAQTLLKSFASGDVLTMLSELSHATEGLSLSASDVDMFLSGMNQMKTTGKAEREFLGYFDSRGLNTTAALSDYLGVNQTQISGMVDKGEITADTAIAAIRAYMQEEYGKLSLELASSYDAMTDNLGDAMDNINSALGSAYNEKSKEGVGEDIAAYSGTLGDAMERMNAVIGEGKGIAENLDRQYSREAISALLLGEETTVYGEEQAGTLQGMHEQYTSLVEQYQSASEEDKAVIASNIEALKGEAESLAETAFNASDTMQGVKDVELDLIAAIRENTHALGMAGYGKDYEIQQETSKGGAALRYRDAKEMTTDTSGGRQAWRVNRAMGQHTVLYDNFPILAHQGEQLLTASEARARGGGDGGMSVTVTGNEFHVRQKSDIESVALALADEIEFRQLAGAS